jgi:phosphatidylglycerophosphate synthase
MDLLNGEPLSQSTKPARPAIPKVRRNEISGSQRLRFDLINGMTLCRFLSPIFIGLYCYSVLNGEVAAATIYVVITIVLGGTDLVDGTLARSFKVPSDFGNKADHASDKVTFVSILIVILILLTHAQFMGWTDFVYWTTMCLMALTIWLEGYVMWLNRDQVKNVDDGANNAGRRKYLIQGIGLMFFAVSLTWFYRDADWLTGFLIVGTIFFALALVPADTSIKEYRKSQAERMLAKV